MPSRRTVLRGAAAAGTAAVAGCGSVLGSETTIESWTPEPGSWPLPQYDPANTAHNPHASPPRSPVTAVDTWDLGVSIRQLIVAGGYVVGAGLDGIRMVRPPDHGRWWNDEVGASAVGAVDGTLYAVSPVGVDESGTELGLLRGVDFDGWWNESRPWATFETGPRYVTRLLPTANAVYLGYPSHADEGALVLDADSGERRTRLRGRGVGLRDGTVYASGDETVAYEPNTGVFADGIGKSWETPWRDDWGLRDGPTIADGLVLVGVETGEGPEADPAVRAVDADSGEERWTTPVESLGETTRTRTAVANGRAFVCGSRYYEPGTVVALSLDGDGVRWTAAVDHWFAAAAVAGETLLTAGGVGAPDAEDATGVVAAFDASNGDPLWRFRTEHPIRGLAPVEDAVYVGTEAGTVHALREE